MPVKTINGCYENYCKLAGKFSEENQQPNKNTTLKNRYQRNSNFHPFYLKFIQSYDSIIGHDFEIDWSLPFSDYENLSDFKSLFFVPFAKDDMGNSFHIFDATKENSPIILKFHDPEVLLVVSSNFCNFVERLAKYSRGEALGTLEIWYDLELEEHIQRIANASSESWQMKQNGGVEFISRENSIQVDFSNGINGEGISLNFFGHLTKLRRNLKSKTISLIKPSEEEVKIYERNNLHAKIGFIGIPIILFILISIYAFMHSTPILGAIVMVPLLTVIGSFVLLFGYSLLYSIYFRFFKP